MFGALHVDVRAWPSIEFSINHVTSLSLSYDLYNDTCSLLFPCVASWLLHFHVISHDYFRKCASSAMAGIGKMWGSVFSLFAFCLCASESKILRDVSMRIQFM